MELLYVLFGIFGYAIIGILVAFVLTTMPMLDLRWNSDGIEEIAVVWPLVIMCGVLMSVVIIPVAIYYALTSNA